MLSEETKKIDIYDILKNNMYLDLFKIKMFDCLKQKVVNVYYLRINGEYKITIKKCEFQCLKVLGIKEVII